VFYFAPQRTWYMVYQTGPPSSRRSRPDPTGGATSGPGPPTAWAARGNRWPTPRPTPSPARPTSPSRPDSPPGPGTSATAR
jgi:hypothetical protein